MRIRHLFFRTSGPPGDFFKKWGGRLVLLAWGISVFAAPAFGAEEADKKQSATVSQSVGTPNAANSADNAKRILQMTNLDDERRWGLTAQMQYRGLLVTDQDPRNDMALRYGVVGSLRLVGQLSAFAQLGLQQNFYPDPNESSFRWRDGALGLSYTHEVALGANVPSLMLNHNFALIVPFSRSSQQKSLIMTPSWSTRALMRVYQKLAVGVDATMQFSWFRYAEAAGIQGDMNRMLGLFGRLFAVYPIFSSPSFGTLRIEAGGSLGYLLDYPSRENYVSDASDRSYSSVSYGWDVRLNYAPLQYLFFDLSMFHDAPMRTDGVINTHFVKREDTMFTAGVTFAY